MVGPVGGDNNADMNGGQPGDGLELSCNAGIVEICEQDESRSNTPCAEDEPDCREATVMACGREIQAYCRQAANCLAVEYSCPDDLQMCDPEKGDAACEAYEMGSGRCTQTIYCQPRPADTLCNAPPSCEQGETISQDECQDNEENCRSVTKCGTTMYCRAEPLVNCAAEPICERGQLSSDTPCDEEDESCTEVTMCGKTIYCREDAQCDGLPACNSNETGSDQVCDDDDQSCRRVEVCGSVLYCRSESETIPVNACGEPSPSDDMMFGEVQIVNDTLYVSASYSGGCAEHSFDACFGDFSEGVPVGTTITITHNANGDTCERAVLEDLTFDLTPLKASYQAGYGVENGTIQIRIPGTRQAIEYNF